MFSGIGITLWGIQCKETGSDMRRPRESPGAGTPDGIESIGAIEMSKTYAKKKQSGSWDRRRKVVALISGAMVLCFVLSIAAQIFIYALAA